MTITLDIRPEVEARLRDRAAAFGEDLTHYVQRIVELESTGVLEHRWDYNKLMSLPFDEQDRILAAAAETATPLYEADLALPPAERELTAFTALDGEDFVFDSPDDERTG